MRPAFSALATMRAARPREPPDVGRLGRRLSGMPVSCLRRVAEVTIPIENMRRTALSAVSCALSAIVASAHASATERTHRVLEGETLWELARDHGCVIEDLRAANPVVLDQTLRIGTELRLPPACRKTARRTEDGLQYEVQPGDTLSRIARRNKTTVEELRLMNGLESDAIRPGQRLRITAGGPRPVMVVAGQSVGKPYSGRLANAAKLGRGDGYHLRRPERAFAAQHVVDHVRNVLAVIRRLHPKLHPIAIGDLSASAGGFISGHRSHQSGRDIDVGLCFRRPPRPYPHEFVKGDGNSLDVGATWSVVRAFADTEAQRGGVEHMFLDYELQKLLYDHARSVGVPRRELERIFQYPHGRFARRGLVRHIAAHDDHLHVRFRCPEGDGGCR